MANGDNQEAKPSSSAVRIGQRLKEARAEAKLTQQEVADRLRIHLNTWQKYETGERVKGWVRIGPVADALETSPNRFFDHKTPAAPEHALEDVVAPEMLAAAMREVANIAMVSGKLDDDDFWLLMAEATLKIIEISMADASAADARSYLKGVLQGFLFERL